MKVFSSKWRLVIIPVFIFGLGWACGGNGDEDGGATVPAAPSALTATAVSSFQINLAWTDNSDNEDEFKFERKVGANGLWEYLGAVTANVVFCSDAGLTPETTYYYRVYAQNPAGDSDYSNEASATTLAEGSGPAGVPENPSGLDSTVVSGSEVDLSWTDNSDDEDGFRLERKEGALGNWEEIADLPADSTGYSDTGLDCGTVYYYRVISYNAEGDSDPSNEITAETQACSPSAPAAPSNLAADAVSDSQVDLSWSDNSDNEDGFRLERKEGDAGNWEEITDLPADSTGYSDTGLDCGTVYSYRILAYNDEGNSNYSNEVSVLTPLADPQGTASGYGNGFLAVGENAVFFSYKGTPNGGVARTNKDGTGVTCVACDSGEPREIVVNNSRVYWTDINTGHPVHTGKLRSAPVTGGAVSDLWNGTIGSPLALDGNYIYWVDDGADDLMRADLNGQNPTVVIGGQTQVNSLAAAGGYLFWTTNNSVLAVEVANPAALITLASGRTIPKSVAADDTDVYWAEGHWDQADNAVYRAPHDGSGPITNVTTAGSASVYAIAIDDTDLYAADNYGNTIWRVAKSGGAPEVLASGQPYPFDIALDADAVYWTSETTAQLYKLDK